MMPRSPSTWLPAETAVPRVVPTPFAKGVAPTVGVLSLLGLRTKEVCKNKLYDWSPASALDARRKFAAETYLSARICNTADKVLAELQSFNLFLHTS